MQTTPIPIVKYLSSRAVTGPWRLQGTKAGGFAGAVVIPALAENDSLPATLHSLAANPPQLLAHFLVVVVINQRADADPADRADNLLTLRRLAAGEFPSALNLAWVDAASPGLELPAGEGVGLARRIGLDLALQKLDWQSSPILVCLDADTLVQPDYLPALDRHFREAAEGGAAIPFRHRPGENPAQEAAIVRYELFLRHYVLGLSLAASPYAYHTVGSALACRAEAYVRAGGMNRRCAGEDFHFLQQLAKTSGVAPVRGTTVFPSPRVSRRVPFGTGPSVGRLLAGEDGAVLFYHPACFEILGLWLQLVRTQLDAPGEELLVQAGKLEPHLLPFLNKENFTRVWERLQRNHLLEANRLQAFHGWFDGLKTLRLVHHLSAGPFPRCGPDLVLAELLRRCGRLPGPDLTAQLSQVRFLQETG